MSDLPHKIQSATEDLRRVRQELESLLPMTPTRLEDIDSVALKDFKAAIDHVRQLVWTYIQADSLKQGNNVAEEVRSLRMQRVTEMLQTIQQEVRGRRLTPDPATVSFLHAVQEIADAAFQKHSSSDSDVDKAS